MEPPRPQIESRKGRPAIFTVVAFVGLLVAIVIISIVVSLMILTIGVIGTLIAWVTRAIRGRNPPVKAGEDPFGEPPDAEADREVIDLEDEDVEVIEETKKETTSI